MMTLKRNILAFLFVVCGLLVTSAQGLKIATVSPDLKVRVTKCVAAGSNVLITLTLENTSSRDVTVSLCGGYDNHSVAIDDEGNKYSVSQILVKIGNDPYNSLFVNGNLFSEVPVKATVKISDVPESINTFSRLNLWFSCNDWNIYGEHIKISNIPIYRDGDD